MPHSLASLNIHLVLSTKDRHRFLSGAGRLRRASHLLYAAVTCCAGLAACGPDASTEALRQENAALRRDAENRDAANNASTPLTDSARAAAGLLPNSGSAAPAKTPGSNVDLTPTDIAEANRLGLPVYPNAKLSKSPGEPDNSVLTGQGVKIVLLETPDKLEPVVAFYLQKMTDSNSDPKHPGIRHIPARADRVQDKFRVVTLSDTLPGGGLRSVTIHEDVGRTYIELINMEGQQIPASVQPPGASKPASSGKSTTAASQGSAAPAPSSAPYIGSAWHCSSAG